MIVKPIHELYMIPYATLEEENTLRIECLIQDREFHEPGFEYLRTQCKVGI